MAEYPRSPSCPLGPAVDELTFRFVENLVLYDNAKHTLSRSQVEKARADDIAEFREEHTAEQLLAARGCAKLISDGECPLWYFDPERNDIVPNKVFGGSSS